MRHFSLHINDGSIPFTSVAVATDGKIFAGGYFTSIGGQLRFKFARLSNDTALQQNLAVTKQTPPGQAAAPAPSHPRNL